MSKEIVKRDQTQDLAQLSTGKPADGPRYLRPGETSVDAVDNALAHADAELAEWTKLAHSDKPGDIERYKLHQAKVLALAEKRDQLAQPSRRAPHQLPVETSGDTPTERLRRQRMEIILELLKSGRRADPELWKQLSPHLMRDLRVMRKAGQLQAYE